MAGGTGIEPCPLQEKCNVFKRFLQEEISVHNPCIEPKIRKVEIGEGWEKIGDE
jgi:hypothetical protein